MDMNEINININTTTTMMMKTTSRKVSFATTQKAYCNPPTGGSSLDLEEEQQSSSWYSQEDLADSREEVRIAMDALRQVEGNLEMIDQSQICLRGIEKYADVVQKVLLQKRHIESILRQQETNRQSQSRCSSPSSSSSSKSSGEDHMALISKLLSQPFKNVAMYYAAQNALQVLQEEEDERQLQLSLSRTEHEAEVSLSLYKDKVLLIETEVVDVMEYPDAQLGLKRARLASFDETKLRRNVKPCLQSSE
jgi:hypothetical protein